MMKLAIVLLALSGVAFAALNPIQKAKPAIWGFHFHTYWFPASQSSMALDFYDAVGKEVTSNGSLAHCTRGRMWDEAIGPHPIAQFTVCCNATSLPTAIGWYMKTRDKLQLPILLHPLTTSEAVDHTSRAMWMGPKVPLDESRLEQKMHHQPICSPNHIIGH